MLRTRVKICGITNPEDAVAAVEAGADAIGLVFYPPSPRAVTLEQAQKVVQVVPAFVTITALFVDPDPEQVQEILDGVRIDLIQFHGNEDSSYCEQFKVPYIKAIRVRQASDVVASSLRFPSAQGILLDSYKPGVPGGTGETFDWSMAQNKEQKDQSTKPIILAGGLNPSNVADAITQVNPFAVDVSGGVEASKGIKDHGKITEFLSEVYRVNRP